MARLYTTQHLLFIYSTSFIPNERNYGSVNVAAAAAAVFIRSFAGPMNIIIPSFPKENFFLKEYLLFTILFVTKPPDH